MTAKCFNHEGLHQLCAGIAKPHDQYQTLSIHCYVICWRNYLDHLKIMNSAATVFEMCYTGFKTLHRKPQNAVPPRLTLQLRVARAIARLHATLDFPTPPFPDSTRSLLLTAPMRTSMNFWSGSSPLFLRQASLPGQPWHTSALPAWDCSGTTTTSMLRHTPPPSMTLLSSKEWMWIFHNDMTACDSVCSTVTFLSIHVAKTDFSETFQPRGSSSVTNN